MPGNRPGWARRGGLLPGKMRDLARGAWKNPTDRATWTLRVVAYSRRVQSPLKALLIATALLVTAAGCVRPDASAEPVAAIGGAAPEETFEVGVRHLDLNRGPGRPLPTTVWYPVGEGRFPIVLFSHGIDGQPEGFADV